MKSILYPIALAGLLATLGCESTATVRSAFQQRLAPAYVPHDVKIDARTAYDVVRLALADLGYTQTRGGAAQGFYEGYGTLQTATPTAAARQFQVKVKIGVSTREPGATEISVLFSSVEDSPKFEQRNMATELPLRADETGLYDVLFGRIDSRIAKLNGAG